jgi:hypothetical protein
MRTFSIVFVSLLAPAATAQLSRNQALEQTWISDVTIISPEKLNHTNKGSVLIENGRIACQRG